MTDLSSDQIFPRAAPAGDLETPRLRLHAVNLAEAHRISARQADASDTWADDYPFEGDLIAVSNFLRRSAMLGEQQPFGYYRITRTLDGRAIGGIGYKGQPEHGYVELGYGVVPSARGQGYAAEATIALLGVAADHGIVKVIADTSADNIASQSTLLGAGFRLVKTDAELHYFEVLLK